MTLLFRPQHLNKQKHAAFSLCRGSFSKKAQFFLTKAQFFTPKKPHFQPNFKILRKLQKNLRFLPTKTFVSLLFTLPNRT